MALKGFNTLPTYKKGHILQCPTRNRTRLAGGPLLRVATIRRTTDTHYRHIPLHFSHNERTLFKFRCNIFIGVRIIKEMPGSVASGTPCIMSRNSNVTISDDQQDGTNF
jgi:hypothetical protein